MPIPCEIPVSSEGGSRLCSDAMTSFIAAVATLSLATLAQGELVLWDTSETEFNSSTSLGSFNQFGADNQVADDINVIGAITRVVAHGSGCASCGTPMVSGVHVRFHEWTEAGPGALEKEFFLPADAPGVVFNPANPSKFDVTLPEPFSATGWHFVSVQPVFNIGGEWRMKQSNLGTPVGSVVQYRANHLNQEWHDDPSADNSDFSIELWGTPGAAPTVQPFDEPATPSSRIVVRGDQFGAAQGSSELLVDGVPALVTTWIQDTIVGYVPEATPPGTVEVVIATDGGTSEPVALIVEPRVPEGRVRWRFAVDGPYMLHRPGLGPDGTVYLNDLAGRVYAVTADGGLLWITDALQGQVGLGSNGPVVVDGSGRIYVAVEPLGPTDDLVAINPDGTIAWTYTDPGAQGIAAGPAIGPDGNVYVAFHDADMESSGCTSLTPEGTLRWSSNGSPPLYEHGATGSELVFGPSTPGAPVDQVVLTVDRNLDAHLYAFDLATGNQNFSVPVSGLTNGFELQHQPETDATSGAIYLAQFTGPGGVGWNLQAFTPSGSLAWSFDPGIGVGLSTPDAGPDGVIYFAWDGGHLSAVTPQGTPLWLHDDNEAFDDGPVVSPDNSVLAINGGAAQETWWVKGIRPADGAELWQVDLPQENGDDIVTFARPIFTPDSSTVYVPTSSGGFVLPDYGYLYAIDARASITGDLNGDGVVDGSDLGILLGAWNSSEALADVDGNGVVDGADLGILIAAWSGG